MTGRARRRARTLRGQLIVGMIIGLSACGGETTDKHRALYDGAVVNRANDAPGNAQTAPLPRSGSNMVPPNANGNAVDGHR